MANECPVSIGVVGMGGYAAQIANLLRAQSALPHPSVKLVSTCDPDVAAHGARAAELKAEGVAVYDSLDKLLAGDVEAVWLPVPIDLHRPFTEQALAAGKAVMCEKPAAGCVDDVDAMIAARDRAKLPVAIGFQDTHADTTAQIKRRILDGELGPITHATVQACWPRDDRYYSRATWAGALRRNGTWVLDSPAQNAISHFITLPLFLLGSSIDGIAVPQTIEAELYRARPTIQSFDTISLRATLPQGRTLLIHMTHGCARQVGPIITIHGERGTMTRTLHETVITMRDGRTSTVAVGDKHADMVRRFAALVRGQYEPQRPAVSLELARPQVVCISAAVQCAPIHAAPAAVSDRGVHVIADIDRVFSECSERNVMLHESGLAPWSKPAGRLDVRDYRHFAGPCCA